MATVQLSDFWSDTWGDIKGAGQSAVNKTVDRAKGVVKGAIDKTLPSDVLTTTDAGGTTIPTGGTEQTPTEQESGSMTKTLLYVAGAGVAIYLIYRALR